MANLILSIVTLAIGPVLVSMARGRRPAMVAVDSFVLVVIGGLVLTHILPEALRAAGAWALLAAIVGFVAPSVAEKVLHHDRGGVRRTAAVLALVGLFVHAAVDGMGLKGHFAFDPSGERLEYHQAGAGPLTWAILLHRIPVGIAIWWIVPRTLGRVMATVAMGVVVLGTVVGWGLGPEWVTGQPGADASDDRTWSWVAAGVFQSLLGGSLLHVLMHAHVPPPTKAGHPTRALQWPSLIGAVLAMASVAAILTHHEHGGTGGARPGSVFVGLALTSAPPLVLAFLAVGLANAFLPSDWTDRLRRGRPATQALKGVLIGLPLPVCSCGVVPLYRELVQKGAAVAAAMAFLIATPELEIAAVFLTWELMGPDVAVARVAMAAVLALAVALLVARWAPPMAPASGDSCCHGGDPDREDLDEEPPPQPSRWRTILWTGFGDGVDNTGAWILIGLGISAYLVPYVDPVWLARLPAGIDVPAAALLGLPLYVCASGSTPLAAVMVAQGLSPGAALAFLITGPATNATTFGLLRSLHGSRTAFIFSLAMLLGATAAGLLTNLALPDSGDVMPHLHDHGGSVLEWACLAILVLALIGALLRNGVRVFVEQILGVPGGGHSHDHGDHDDHGHGTAATCH